MNEIILNEKYIQLPHFYFLIYILMNQSHHLKTTGNIHICFAFEDCHYLFFFETAMFITNTS